MDHDLRLISYIADVGSILVLMVRRSHLPVRSHSFIDATTSSLTSAQAPPPSVSLLPTDESANGGTNNQSSKDTNASTMRSRGRTPFKIICHLFESDEVGNFISSASCVELQMCSLWKLKFDDQALEVPVVCGLGKVHTGLLCSSSNLYVDLIAILSVSDSSTGF